MKIALSGYRGLVGSALEIKLLKDNHEVVRLSRGDLYNHQINGLSSALSGCDAVIHLAGAPVLQRWTRKNRKVILESRAVTTRNLVRAVAGLPVALRPGVFISASAIGIYRSGVAHTEKSEDFADHFAAEVSRAWEAASVPLPPGVRRVVFRISLVLDRNSRLIRMLRIPFLIGAGGPVGKGSQPFPFIHLDDLTDAMLWALKENDVQGIYNLAAPEQVTQKQFSQQLGSVLHRPAAIPVPEFFLRMVFGQAALLVTESPVVIPERMVEEGFVFRYPTLRSALEEIVQ